MTSPTFCRQLPFKLYTQKNGLASNQVNCIIQDKKGYLWLGTNNGLSRFNGIDFRNFKHADGLPGNRINVLTEDRKGNLWIGTDPNGAACYSGKRFYCYSTRDGLGSNRVFDIKEDKKGILWFATGGGLSRFDGSTFKSFTIKDGLPSNYVTSLYCEPNGRIWFGTNKGLLYLHGKDLEHLQPALVLRDTIITTLQPAGDGSGTVWVGSSKGLYLLEPQAPSPKITLKGLKKYMVRAVFHTKSGKTWCGTENGLFLMSEDTVSTIDTAKGLPSNSIRTLQYDQEGNLWIGTQNGACQLSNHNVETYSAKDGLAENLTTYLLMDRKKRIWAGTANGLSCYTGNRFENYSTKDGLAYQYINHLLEAPNGDIWIATTGGISVFCPESKRFTNYIKQKVDELPGRYAFRLFQGRNGVLWIGGSSGIACYKNGKFSNLPINTQITNVSGLLEDQQGDLWFSSQKKIYQLKGKSLYSYSSDNGLVGGRITNLFLDSRNRLWIASEEGLTSHVENTFTTYTTRDGLTDNHCNFILETPDGSLWIGTARGLTHYDGKNFRTYSVPGMDLNTMSWLTGISDHKSHLWLGSTEGIIHIRPPFFKVNHTPPPVYITGVKVLEQEFPLNQPNRLHQLSHKENYIHFSFTGLSFTSPEMVRYRYRLQGMDDTWRKTANRTVSYPYLPPGKYRFHVKAVNHDGTVSEQPAELAFAIRPPFWQTWWFRLMMALTLTALMGLFIRWRVKRGREKAELKAKNQQLITAQRMELMGALATGTVHDLKNLLSIIIGYSRLVKPKTEADGKSNQYIETIKNTAETATQMARQILSFSRLRGETPQKVDLGIWLGEILKTLEVSKPKHIHTHWTPPPEPILFAIHPTRFQQVVMNLCLNAIHAMPEGGDLTLALEKMENNAIHLSVADTGTGMDEDTRARIFDPLYTTKETEKGTGLGLFVVKQIVTEHNGSVEVSSKQGIGTTFTVKFCEEVIL